MAGRVKLVLASQAGSSPVKASQTKKEFSAVKRRLLFEN
jgi:hypothetical protein